jgi:predicted RNA-binding Zn-ribbon protein involved in translation (DUF1610 family)
MSEPIKIKATLHVSMNFECPKCGEYDDLFNVPYMDDDGQIWSLINARSAYGKKDPWKNISGDGDEFECPNCKAQLLFDELEY